VVREFGHAKAALSFLREKGSGSATFLPLETLPPANGTPAPGRGVRWAHTLVGCEFESLVHYLLGQVGVVDHLDRAEALWRRNGAMVTYVTPGGEVLSPSGRLTGGHQEGTEQSDHSLLQRKRALRQLREEVGQVTAEVTSFHERVLASESEVHDYRGKQPSLQHSLQSHGTTRLAAEKEMEQLSREDDRMIRLIESLEGEDLVLQSEEAEAQGEF
jgi:chromosome segregation protein